MNVGTLHVRVTYSGPSLASKDNSHEQSVILSILKRGYYRPQVNVGTLHARVASARPSLASKDHSHEHSVISAILKRGYYRLLVNVGPLSTSVIHHRCQFHYHSPFVGRIHIIDLLPLCPRRVHVFDLIFLSKEIPYLQLVSPFWRRSISSSFVVPSLFLLARKLFSNYTKLVMEIVKL